MRSALALSAFASPLAPASTGGTELLGAALALVFVLVLVGAAIVLGVKILDSARNQDHEQRIQVLEHEVERLRERIED